MPSATIIHHLREYCALLTRTPLSGKEAAEAVGTIREQIFDQYEVTPNAPEFEHATVQMRTGGEEINFLRLILKEGILLDDITAEFGGYQDTAPMPDMPDEGLIPVDTGSPSHTVTLIIPLDKPTLKTLTLRRDQRLGV